jgi:phosphoglycolate phosphatase-like HAD superfamily hydrolase
MEFANSFYMKTQQILNGVLLDVDGTLLDSNAAHAQSWREALRVFGINRELRVIRPLIGMGGDRLLPELCGVEEASELGKKISQARQTIFTEGYLPGLRPFPGARELVLRMSREGLKLGVATSSGQGDLAHLLERARVADLLPTRVTKDDVDSSKPGPDIVCVGLERLGCRAEEALMLGDTPYDARAARNAGVRAVAVRSGGWGDRELLAAGAVSIYDDVAGILAEYESSPFSRGNPYYSRAAI